jgi:thiamine biosynthesis lipoprotein
LVRLNANGKLDNPPLDMVALLSQAAAIHQQTNGAFDPTIQPAWTRLAENSGKETSNAPALPIGFDHVTRSTSRIAYTKPGMAMTLNGIAQGYATDRIADLLKSQGLNNVLVEVGEIRALGNKSDGKPWSVGIADTADRDVIVDRIALADRAIATSSPLGTTVDAAGTIGHILQPQTGQPGGQWRQVSVMAPTATVADGLSTAFCLMHRDAIKAALTAFDQVEVRLEADDGMVTRLG